MPRQLITFPRNLSAATTRVLYVDAAGASQIVDVSVALGAETMEANRPVREFYAWPGKRNYQGLWWSSTTGNMIPFESLLERQALTGDHGRGNVPEGQFPGLQRGYRDQLDRVGVESVGQDPELSCSSTQIGATS